MIKPEKASKEELKNLLSNKRILAVSSSSLSMPTQAVEKKTHNYTNVPFIPWFDGDNAFPDKLNERARLSTTHRRILRDKANFTTGDGFIFEGKGAKIAEAFALKVNPMQTLREVYKNEAKDYTRFGDSFIEIEKINATTFNIYHKDASCCREGKEGDVILYSRDFKNYTKPEFKPLVFPKFPNFGKVEDFKNERSILHVKDYESGYAHYGLADYIAAYFNGWIDIDYQIPKYNNSRFQNQFRPSGILVIVGQNTTDEQAIKLKDYIAEEYRGEGKNSQLITVVVGDEKVAPKYIPFDDAPEGAFNELQLLATEHIIVSHSWHPALMINNGAKIGSNAPEIRTAFEYVMGSAIQPIRDTLNEAFVKIFNFFGMNLTRMDCINSNPVSYISEIDPMEVLLINEMRDELGYEPIEGGDTLLVKTAKNRGKIEITEEEEDGNN